jgi:hypothetical protein
MTINNKTGNIPGNGNEMWGRKSNKSTGYSSIA